jgi:hypothetical protein
MVTDSPIATNPLNAKDLLLGSVDFNCPRGLSLGFHLSRDGGSTWPRVTCVPGIIIMRRLYQPVDEPSVGYDRKGTAYVAGAYVCLAEGCNGNYGLVAVQKSTDGIHWGQPVVAMRSPGQTGPYLTHMVVDASAGSPWANSVYVSGVMVTDQRTKNQVMVSHSADGGVTWTQSAVNPVQAYPDEDDFTRMAVGKDGTVFISWTHCRGTKESGLCPTVHIMFSKSTDGGNTWSPAQRIATVGMPHDWLLPNSDTGVRVSNYPAIGIDNSDGPHAGNLYMAMYTWTGTYLRVQVIRSADGGNTWSKPVPLAPPSDTHDQFFPALSVSPAGKVGVSWLDRRNDPNNIDYQAFAAVSTDGGRTFPNTQLTKAFSNPDNNGTGNNWMGDYAGNTWAGPDFIAAWMDSSNGIDMQEVIGGIRLK